MRVVREQAPLPLAARFSISVSHLRVIPACAPSCQLHISMPSCQPVTRRFPASCFLLGTHHMALSGSESVQHGRAQVNVHAAPVAVEIHVRKPWSLKLPHWSTPSGRVQLESTAQPSCIATSNVKSNTRFNSLAFLFDLLAFHRATKEHLSRGHLNVDEGRIEHPVPCEIGCYIRRYIYGFSEGPAYRIRTFPTRL